MQSLPRTFSAHLAPPLVVDLAKVMELYQNDLSDAICPIRLDQIHRAVGAGGRRAFGGRRRRQ